MFPSPKAKLDQLKNIPTEPTPLPPRCETTAPLKPPRVQVVEKQTSEMVQIPNAKHFEKNNKALSCGMWDKLCWRTRKGNTGCVYTTGNRWIQSGRRNTPGRIPSSQKRRVAFFRGGGRMKPGGHKKRKKKLPLGAMRVFALKPESPQQRLAVVILR